jgi:hypothetical protein
MREDQYLKLQALQEDLAEVVVQEVDPNNWPGSKKTASEMTKEERGDRYWCKKNAAATLTLLNKVITLTERPTRELPTASAYDGDDDGDLDKEIASTERQAMKQLEKFQAKHGTTGTH